MFIFKVSFNTTELKEINFLSKFVFRPKKNLDLKSETIRGKFERDKRQEREENFSRVENAETKAQMKNRNAFFFCCCLSKLKLP